jgi:hypothetical protein
MQQRGLHGRHRVKNGEISCKHGNTLVRILRKLYGPGLPAGEPKTEKLQGMLSKLYGHSSSQLVNDQEHRALIRLGVFGIVILIYFLILSKSWAQTDSTGGGAASMVSGWPDAILCNVTTPKYGQLVFYANALPASDMPMGRGLYFYRYYGGGSTSFDVIFNSDGSFNSYLGFNTSNCKATILTLYTNGQAFNFRKP